MDKKDLGDLEKKVLNKKWGQKKSLPEYESYKEDDRVDRLGWQESRRTTGFFSGGFKLFWFFLFSIVVSVFLYYYYFLSTPLFEQDSVKIFISGPSKVSSGDLVSYKVSYRNNSKIILRDVNLVFEWPAGSYFEENEGVESVKVEKRVGVLMPSQEKSLILEGRIYGEKDSQKTVKATLSYSPEELKQTMVSYSEFTTTIETIPVFLNTSLPDQIVSGKEFELKVEYINQSDATFPNMEIRAEYPQGFEFISSNPNPAIDDNIWQLGTIQGGEEGVIVVKGIFSGVEGENNIISVDMGQTNLSGEGFLSIANSLSETKIASSALLVFQTVNGARDTAINMGDSLNYKINYKNTTNAQISNVILLAQLDDSFVDISTLDISFGSFDGRTNSIIWSQSGVPGLAVLDPGEEGFVSFSVSSRSGISPKSLDDKNLEIASTVQITSGSIPEKLEGLPVDSQDTVKVKLNTILGFNTSAYYNDGPIKNSGAMPPKVGRDTTYAVSWQIANSLNDAKNVVIEASVPLSVRWTGVVDPPDAGITFDENTGLIRWEPGVVFAGSGYTIPSQRVDFQLSYQPSIIDVGKPFQLMSESKLTAVDAFTGYEISRSSLGVDSSLRGLIDESLTRVVR